MPKDTFTRTDLPVASVRDRLAFIAEVVAPTLAKGPLARRPRVVGLAETLGLDGRAVHRMQQLRATYGEGPVLVPLPGRLHAVVLSPDHAIHVLENTPDPFSPATDEKRRALSHFEPHVSLISTGPERRVRRDFNEQVLDTDRPVHALADDILLKIEQEMQRLLAGTKGRLDWESFITAWYALVRRIVLGDGARDDGALTDLLTRLRHRGNWVMLARRRGRKIEELRARIRAHLDRAEPGSFAARIAALPGKGTAEPADQVAHYLFAFDPGGMATFRALALLSAHPAALAEARGEQRESGGRSMLPLHRAAILESLRLWPTTPVILRQAARDVDLGTGRLPKDANIIIYAPFLHRDPGLSFADRFAPELWLDERRGVRTVVDGPLALVPFSAGPGRCPAADVVPMVGSAALAFIIAARTPRLTDPSPLLAGRPMPGTLDNYSLAFELGPA